MRLNDELGALKAYAAATIAGLIALAALFGDLQQLLIAWGWPSEARWSPQSGTVFVRSFILSAFIVLSFRAFRREYLRNLNRHKLHTEQISKYIQHGRELRERRIRHEEYAVWDSEANGWVKEVGNWLKLNLGFVEESTFKNVGHTTMKRTVSYPHEIGITHHNALMTMDEHLSNLQRILEGVGKAGA